VEAESSAASTNRVALEPFRPPRRSRKTATDAAAAIRRTLQGFGTIIGTLIVICIKTTERTTLLEHLVPSAIQDKRRTEVLVRGIVGAVLSIERIPKKEMIRSKTQSLLRLWNSF
jgi:hypothetical protein